MKLHFPYLIPFPKQILLYIYMLPVERERERGVPIGVSLHQVFDYTGSSVIPRPARDIAYTRHK